jgi:hypothetical protein
MLDVALGEVRVEGDDRGFHAAKLGRMDPCRNLLLMRDSQTLQQRQLPMST